MNEVPCCKIEIAKDEIAKKIATESLTIGDKICYMNMGAL